MTQLRFEQENGPRWDRTEALLQAAPLSRPAPGLAELPKLHRQICADLALAQHRMYGASLGARLNDLAIRTRDTLTRGAAVDRPSHWARLWGSCPRALRREAPLFWLNMLLFWGPFAALILAAYRDERWLFAVLDASTMEDLDGMYGGDSPSDHLRGAFGSDFAMFAFYVQHNIGIGLRTIAGGVLATLGALGSTAQQGVLLGAAFGYVHHAGHTERFYTFVAGHSAFELMGLVICGVAGTRLGLAVLRPGPWARGESLRRAAQEALPLIYGGPLLVLLAAFVEGFWSASAAPPEVKWLVGLLLWLLLAAWLGLAGRGQADET